MVNTVSREKRLKKWLKRYFGMSVGSIVFNAVNYLLFLGFAFCMFYPFWYVVSHSLRSYTLIDDVPRLVYSFKAYVIVFGNSGLVTSFLLSVGVVLAHVVLHIIVTMLAAYPLSKRDLRGRTGILLFITFTMLFSGGLIPFYLLIRDIGLRDNILVYILPGVASGYNVIIAKNFVQSIPDSLTEAAKIDGAGEFTTLVRIVFPLSMPIIATVALWAGVGKWNDWMTGMLYVTDPDMRMIQNFLRSILISASSTGQGGVDSDVMSMAEGVKMAAVVVSIIPILLVYPFLQKYFVKGVLLGSVKG
ncbi:MAG: carbohydrate ABC transporter permease [Clostridia bacterium]|jgi:putative aldouronate transport system permease protein|nr:carbohydrate ABC transporter permease [Clostridia bacterium]